MKVSIVMPAYNEEKRIGKTLERFCEFFERKKGGDFDYEILVVINGTVDKTEEVVKNLQKRYKTIKCLNFKRGGKGFAVTEGFKDALKSNFDIIGYVDADLATSPDEFWKLIEILLISKDDGAIADRYIKGAKIIPAFSFRRIVVSRVFNFLVRIIFGFNYKDTQCGAKVFTNSTIKKILPRLTITEWAYDVNILYICKKENLRITSIPTIWREARGSKLKINKASIQMLVAIVQLRLLHSPLKNSLKVIKPLINKIYKTVK